MKFILLHETKNDDGIRTFFMDVWELYVKVSCPGCSGDWLRLIPQDAAEPVPHRVHTDPERCV